MEYGQPFFTTTQIASNHVHEVKSAIEYIKYFDHFLRKYKAMAATVDNEAKINENGSIEFSLFHISKRAQ